MRVFNLDDHNKKITKYFRYSFSEITFKFQGVIYNICLLFSGVMAVLKHPRCVFVVSYLMLFNTLNASHW
jgi:hypothetical protein